jgi:acyl-coenzyme A thioesterase 13
MSAESAGKEPYGAPVVLTEGPFKGWTTWGAGADPFETTIGPFCFHAEGSAILSAFQPRRERLNGGGAIHGGALMSFADFSLFSIAHNALAGAKAVTLTCNCEFLSAGGADDIVTSQGEVLRETRSLLFVRGIITQSDRPLLAFSGTLKKIALPRT